MKLIRTPVCLLLVLFLNSCALQYVPYKIDVLEPSDIVLPSHIKSIGLVNQVFPEYDQFIQRKSSPDPNDFKKNIALEIAYGIQDNIMASPRFDSLKMIGGYYAIFGYRLPFPWETIEEICLRHHVDGLLVLNYIDYKISNEIFHVADDQEAENTSEKYNNGFKTTLNTNILSNFLLLDPYNRTIVEEKMFMEQLKWEGFGYLPPMAEQELPSSLDALNTTAYFLGEKYVRHMLPYWKTTDRKLFIAPNENLNRAKAFVDSNQWTKAAEIWMAHVDYPNVRVARAARMNLALYYEISGNLWQARYWALKTYYEFELVTALQYAEELNKRLGKESILNQQLH